MTENKQYGQFFIFEVGDLAVKILPTDYDANYSDIDLSKPHEVIKIDEYQNKESGDWYQIIYFENGGWHNAIEFRLPDKDMTDEIRKAHQDFMMWKVKKGKKPSTKRKSKTKTRETPRFGFK